MCFVNGQPISGNDIIDNPELINELEDNSTIEFLQKDYPETKTTDDVVADKYIRIKRSFEIL